MLNNTINNIIKSTIHIIIMKTFFTVVEKHSRQNLGVDIFTDEKYDFHQNREEFVFDTRYNALEFPNSLANVEADIAEDLPNSSGDLRSPSELVVGGPSALLPSATNTDTDPVLLAT